MKLAEHPSVKRFHERRATQPPATPAKLDAAWLKQLCRDAGADDVGLVEIGRSALDDQRADILQFFPGTKTLIAFVCRMNREPIRSTARSVANLEFHHTGEEVNTVARKVVAALEERGIAAVNPAMGFPMEMDRFPGKIWVVSHKPVAVAAGLGQMGIHRNVIHPKFGNFILLDTVLVAAEATAYDQPIDYNPCLECKLCVAACPTGAISPDGRFNFSACYSHNYREFMGGFTNWVEKIAESEDARDYRRQVSDSESASMWQSLSFGANYKAAYCLSVCPAGEDVIGSYLTDKPGFVRQIVRPLQEKEETVYVVPGSDAETCVGKHFPTKQIKRVSNGLRPRTVKNFLAFLPLVFQPGQSKGMDATYHFSFTGAEECQATIVIRDGKLTIEDGHTGTPDLRVTADARTWLGFVAKEKSLVWALLTRRLRLKGPPSLLVKFGKCFPS
jgi:NAD-dependent dihydropyrimidine dehydrogenase PreA subunit